MIYLLVAVGFSLVFSILRVANFAHGEFYMLGGIVALIMYAQMGVPFALTVILAAIVVGIFGAAVERLILRPFRSNELNGMIVLLGVSIILQNIGLLIYGSESHGLPAPATGLIRVGPIFFPLSRLVVLAGCIVIFTLFWLLISQTQLGRAMRAMAQDPEVARQQGIRLDRVFPIAFGLGVGLAGAAGALMAPLNGVSPFVGLTPMIKAFMVVVLGGVGSIPGAALGGLLIGLIESILYTTVGSVISEIFLMLLIILILIVRPNGLLGYRARET